MADNPLDAVGRHSKTGISKALGAFKGANRWVILAALSGALLLFWYLRRQNAQNAAANSNPNATDPNAGLNWPAGMFGGTIIEQSGPISTGPGPTTKPPNLNPLGVTRYPPPGNVPPGPDPPRVAPFGFYYASSDWVSVFDWVLAPLSPTIIEDPSVLPKIAPPPEFKWQWIGARRSHNVGWVAVWQGSGALVVHKPPTTGGGLPKQTKAVHLLPPKKPVVPHNTVTPVISSEISPSASSNESYT